MTSVIQGSEVVQAVGSRVAGSGVGSSEVNGSGVERS